LTAEVRRIVTLVPSATEIVCALGLGDRLVGRSHECDHPGWVARLPAVTRAEVDSSRSSREIDADVRGRLAEALSLYTVDRERLAALRPELVVTQDQCDVCAVSFSAVEAALAEWTGGAPRLVSLQPARLADIWDDARRVADAAGIPEAGDELAGRLAARVAEVAARTEGRGRPTVAAIEWLDPLMAAGNWVPELIELAGGRDLFGTPGAHAPSLTWDDLRAADPDVIVTMPCGFDIPRTRAELAALTERPGWAALRAVRGGRVYLTDGNQYFNRPGPRLAESAEILAEILHPKAAGFGHENAGWVALRSQGSAP